MLIGAAPGSDDERQGEAFAGPAGRLVDAMLAAIGLTRDSVYLANLIPWRPPGNRPPTPLEAGLCLPFARRHIALARPEIILCLGERAAQLLLLDTKETLSRLRGRWHDYPGADGPIRLAVTFSPDYLLSQPLQKRRAWRDLLDVARALESSQPSARP
jgi:DNA polymerase